MTEQQPLIPLSPGERLRHERERRGWSVADTAARLRVGESVITALELDAGQRYAPVYRRGFLKRYAQLLEVPAEEVASWLDPLASEAQELRSVFPVAPSVRPADRWLKATSYVLASLLVGTLAWQMSHEAVRLSQGTPEAEIAARPGESDPASQPRPSGNHVNASIAALENLRPAGGPKGLAGQRAWAALNPDTPQAAKSLEPGEHVLSLLASADSWVEITGRDGELLEQDLVRGGSSREYRGYGPYRITLGRASAIQLFIDGESVDLSAVARGDVARWLLDPDAPPSVGDAADGEG